MTITFLPLALLKVAHAAGNRYDVGILAASHDHYRPHIQEPLLVNAWGIAIRPAGAGGHFWVTGKDISFEYVGDVHGSESHTMRTLHVDGLKYVHLPVGGDDHFATGVVYVDSKRDFVISQDMPGTTPITAPAKFIFASDGGIISAWTERKKADGSFDRPEHAIVVVDHSVEGAQFFGLAINSRYTRLYAADFGRKPGIKVFDGKFRQVPVAFDMPFDSNHNGKVDAGEYAPFNIQLLTTPSGREHLFVSYAMTQACPADAIIEKLCKAGEIYPGEEDSSHAGYGRIAEFTENGKLVAVWKDGGRLNAPWGMAFAPDDFGSLAGTLLVANFGDGTIAAYNARTREFIDMLRDANGQYIKIDKIWGLIFGNGVSLGDRDALYFAAGPDDESKGIFGSIRAVR